MVAVSENHRRWSLGSCTQSLWRRANHASARMRLEERPSLPPRRALLAERDWWIVQPGLPHAVDDRARELAAGEEVLESNERCPCDGAAENHRLLRSPSNSARISRNGTLGPGTGGAPTRGRSGGVNQHFRTASAKTGLLVSLGRPISATIRLRSVTRRVSPLPRLVWLPSRT